MAAGDVLLIRGAEQTLAFGAITAGGTKVSTQEVSIASPGEDEYRIRCTIPESLPDGETVTVYQINGDGTHYDGLAALNGNPTANERDNFTPVATLKGNGSANMTRFVNIRATGARLTFAVTNNASALSVTPVIGYSPLKYQSQSS